MMRAYELMVIIDGDVEDPKAQAWIKTVTDGDHRRRWHDPRQARLVGQAPVRLPDQQEGVRLLPRRRGARRRAARSTSSSARCASRTTSSATS